MAPDGAVIATNTSSLPLDRLAGALRRPERFLGWHWFNPAHLIPLVEVVPAPATDPDVVRWSVATLQELGKRPLALSRPIEGFLANRLQYALIREALALVQDGAATPEQIDAVMTDCLGPRWAVSGRCAAATSPASRPRWRWPASCSPSCPMPIGPSRR